VVSGSKNRRDVLSALEAGVHGFISKGLGVTELAHALRLILDGVIYVPAAIATLPSGDEQALVRRDPARPHKSTLAILTPRQRGVLELLVEGKSNKAIARDLGLGEGTVKVHMAALFRSLDVKSRTAAAVAGGRLLRAGS